MRYRLDATAGTVPGKRGRTMNKDLSNLTNKVLAEICRISDAHNIDRDSALKYFADMLTAFTEVATIQNYDSKQTNADRIRSMTDEELAEFLKEVKEDYQWANPDYPDCDDCGEWLNWLQSEAEMEENDER